MAFGELAYAPTEQENDKLAKLKAQNQELIGELREIDIQVQALNMLKQMTTAKQQSKYSELLAYSEAVKKNHGWSKDVSYDPQQGENGRFYSVQSALKK